MTTAITPELIVHAYSQGIFPMARSRRGAIEWFSPDPRAILPLDAVHVPRSLARRVRSARFEIRFDTAFDDVIKACAKTRPGHEETWINDTIIRVYGELHRLRVGHSVEAWTREDEPKLVGGLYGLALGGAFFGESMFSAATDASKVCFVHLVEHLNARGFALLDTQITNPHMEQFGIVEIPRDKYLTRLRQAIRLEVGW